MSKNQRKISLEFVNGYLEAMSCLNTGVNHGCDYSMQELDANGTWLNAIEKYFASIKDDKGNQYDHSLWDITTTQITPDTFTKAITQWFLQEPYSPVPHKDNGLDAVDGFLDALLPIRSTKCYLYRVNTVSPMSVWYDIIWDDFVIIYENQRYLLHFGFSD